MIRAGISEPISWNNKAKPAFDAFDELKPDIFLVSDYDLEPVDIKCLNEFRQTIFVLHKSYPLTNQTYSVKPDLAFSSARKELSGLPCIPCAVDTLNMSPVNPIALLAVSAIVEQKEKLGYVLPFCSHQKNLNLALFSNSDLGLPQYFGPHEGNTATIYARSMLSIIFGSKHESNHRLYDCVKYGGLPVVEYNETDQHILHSSFSTFQNSDDIAKWIEYYGKYPAHRNETIKLLAEKCAEKHTYFHRAFTMFDALGMTDEASKIEGVK